MSARNTILRATGLAGLAVATLVAPMRSAHAATATATLSVSMTVTSSCSVTTSTLAFGTQTAAAVVSGIASGNFGGAVTATCTNGTPYTISLDGGSTAGGTTTTRKMIGLDAVAGHAIPYTLQQTSGGSNWGNVPGSDTPASVTGTGAAASAVSVFGAVTATATPVPQTYSDSVTVTVTY